MSWPPPGVDLSLNDLLLRRAQADERKRNSLLDLQAEFGRLVEARKRVTSATEADALFTGADELARRASESGDATLAMLAGKFCAELLLDRNQIEVGLARLQVVRDAYAPVVANGGAGERSNDVELLGLMGRSALALRDCATASEYFGKAIAEIEQDRYRITAPYSQSAYLNGRADIYTAGIGAAFKLGDKETMLARAELSKARWAVRILRDVAMPPDSAHLERFWSVCDQIRALDPTASGQLQSDKEKEILNNLLEERRRLWDLLVIERFGKSEAGPSFSIKALQDTIGPETGILYYYWLDADVVLVTAIDGRQVVVEPVILNDKERASLLLVLNVIKSGWAELDPRLHAKFDRSIQDCARLLPEKIRPLLEDKKRLLISPHRQLHLFPFHALPWEAGFLIEEFAISYMPNLCTLLARPGSTPMPKTLVAGVGTFPGSFNLSSLPAVESDEGEVQGIARISQEAGIPPQVLSGPALTRRQMAAWNRDGTLGTFSCIHLATHGSSVLAPDSLDTPMESRLFLYDGAWDGLEISWLKLDADLVVLSACNSGQRAIKGRELEELPGDEIFGIQSALAMAGARAVLGCLWPTNDEIAREIMIGFHRRFLTHFTPEVSLQESIAGYLRSAKERHCYQWAHFFLLHLRSAKSNNHERNQNSNG
jgi:CHAT domain-containing protein